MVDFNVVCRFVELLFDLSHLGLECVKIPLVALSFFLEFSLQVICGHVRLSQLCLNLLVCVVRLLPRRSCNQKLGSGFLF